MAERFRSFIFPVSKPSTPNSLDANLIGTLPTRSQGLTLLEYFLQHINWIYHVIHIPTVKKIYENVYDELENKQQPNDRQLALILTIFALSAYYAMPSAGLYLNMKDARSLSQQWSLFAQELLLATNCLAFPAIESLQSLILIAHHLIPNVGAIATLKTLMMTIMQLAQAMSLHTIDSPKNKRRRHNSPVDWVDIEVKRRLWWHIASCDWYDD